MYTVHSGRFRAMWEPAARRWLVFGPGEVLLARIPGKREHAVYYMRAMQGLPATPPNSRSVVRKLIEAREARERTGARDGGLD